MPDARTADFPNALPALEAIVQIMELKPRRGDKGTIACPKCGGKFQWSFNGPRAMSGCCETPDCLSFFS